MPQPDNAPSRRRFLASGAALGAAAAGLTGSGGARANASDATAASTLASYRRRVGDIEIVTLLDGYIPFEFGVFRGIDEASYRQQLRNDYIDPAGPLNVGISAHLVRVGDRLALIDAGAADAFGPTAGRVAAALDALGVAPDDVTDLLLTHMHPDHIGGAMRGGEPAFANAALHVADEEAAFWTDAENRAAAGESAAGFFDLAAGLLDAYGDRVNRFGGEAEPFSGVRAESMPGHTPGHTGYRLSSGDDQVLVWGDMTAIAPVQFERPAVGIVYDVDSELAAETRRRWLDRVSADRLLVAGTHLPFPAYGHVERRGDAYAWIPEPWRYGD